MRFPMDEIQELLESIPDMSTRNIDIMLEDFMIWEMQFATRQTYHLYLADHPDADTVKRKVEKYDRALRLCQPVIKLGTDTLLRRALNPKKKEKRSC